MDHLENQEILLYQNKIREALANQQIDQFRAEYLELHPYDQAAVFEEQPEEIRKQIYSYLSPDETAEIMENVNWENADVYFTEMYSRYAAQVLAEMSADDAVDILKEMDKNKVASFITIMEKESADEIKHLLHYEDKTAGSIMTTEFVSVSATDTVREAMLHLRAEAPDAETIYYTYVVDQDKKLVGVISLRNLIIAEKDWLISEVMSDRIVSVDVGGDQEHAAQMMRDYDFLALPVVDFQNHILGIITVDDILDVMEEEADEDYSRLAGVSDTEKGEDSAFVSARKRLPWLVVLLFLGMITASMISRFENTLSQVAILASFIPLIGGMGGNTGTQALAVAVRGMATGDVAKRGKMRMVMREGLTGIITGLSCGIVITIVVTIWQKDFFLGLLVGLSIFATLIIATLAGAIIPLLMHKLNIDPAIASGPFITTINDIISILIYFGLATAFMGLLTQ
ncbi:magnesium transporter [Terribacillus saccharophilus]|jgi:magnesium transporter|uniref:Magnesium transporter MgtE n=1 Tax=Terribacillus saccharophilus TaxID=361277 RepID=A0A268HB88_9BACI|nr:MULTISPECIES: magnesium transporter [Terribacillus]PAD34974.1 magnesium transporter [Terribacillus saccharophilus]PAD95685.1 magnesium transporter [Terribacillus saccharophilus]PAD99255.1 magnesium transporter [Terribacillus saccharophilus]PAE07146.1 magnesium transporter [Terribacillus saccharophilus]VVM34527.1 Magnesium transporter [Terribacillus sp. AE2B 122]